MRFFFYRHKFKLVLETCIGFVKLKFDEIKPFIICWKNWRFHKKKKFSKNEIIFQFLSKNENE